MTSTTQLQTNNKTYLGRYWTETNVLSRSFPSHDNLKILSFGCSTGEELATLRLLFPGAKLYGCDIDWHSLEAARALAADYATVFMSTAREIEAHGPYDIIMCNSVLLSHTRVENGKKKGVSAQFWGETLELLDKSLKTGGVIQIINSNIPFRFFEKYSSYTELNSPLILCPHFVDMFDLDGTHLCTGVAGSGWSPVVGRHLGEEGWQLLTPQDFKCVHFMKGSDTTHLLPVTDEVLPNLARQQSWASGTTSYRPHIPKDARPSSHIEIDVKWQTYGVDAMRIERESRRVWFDGSLAYSETSVSEMEGSEAAAAIEIMSGRRPSRLSLEKFASGSPIRSVWL